MERLRPEPAPVPAEYVDPLREAVLRELEIDLRVVSYDMFCSPPPDALEPGVAIDWWGALDRSTPNRMWRQQLADATTKDVWGIHRRVVEHAFGSYDEIADYPLREAQSVRELEEHPWPEPAWWDFGQLPAVLLGLDPDRRYHLRYRIGSVFETAWQLRGMEETFVDLLTDPEIPRYLMGRITEIHVENTRRVLELAGDRIDLVYFYDDVAAQNSLLVSPAMWRTEIRPHHARLLEPVLARGIPVMYHCDGAVAPLVPELIELGVDVLNPVQPDAAGMDARTLKDAYGDRLAFHGGIDIIGTLPHGTPAEVADEVRERVEVLGAGGGYVLCSSHHIQPDTRVENVLAMYEPELRVRQ